jgi:hypothetical protein
VPGKPDTVQGYGRFLGGTAMTHTVCIDSLVYSPDLDTVRAVLSGDMGGRHVDLQLQFPLRSHGGAVQDDLRRSALQELQQILRSASNVTLAGRPYSDEPETPEPDRATSRWEGEGGSSPARSADIVWV